MLFNGKNGYDSTIQVKLVYLKRNILASFFYTISYESKNYIQLLQ